ncbi:MAG: anhydro-N-acetylmuramic acid kinase, partial [Clostridia bacterium]|nr:anhydro-N-acetylmuramic acid kinase [Clostridia bacterium]
KRLVIGLMSGTSVDGVDAALIETDGKSAKLLGFDTTPFPDDVRNRIFELFDPKNATVDKVGTMNVLLGEIYADCSISLAKKCGYKISDISLIGSHGQTIYHAPERTIDNGYSIAYTVQIGEGSVIADRTGIPCVSDFRPADIAAGGQGAPLVPFAESILYGSDVSGIMLQNIGGIGNVTVLPRSCRPDEIYAFDTGPGNMIIDALISDHTSGKQKYDANGAIAFSGKVDGGLLEFMYSDGYIDKEPPKSTGREYYGADYVKKILAYSKKSGILFEDIVATATYFTCFAIERSYELFIKPKTECDTLVVGGGGAHNITMMSMLSELMAQHGIAVKTQESLGYSSDAKEAVAFALLADYAYRGQYNNLPSATGADHYAVLGKISYGKAL